MGESAVALRYAEALYELAREQGRGVEVLRDLASLRAALEAEPEGWRQLSHPELSPEAKQRVLAEHFLPGREPLVANLLGVLVSKRREGVLRDLFRAYQEVYDRREGILRVEVESATPLEGTVASTLRDRISEMTGREVFIEERVDPELIGGLRMVVDSRVIDGSTKSRLERLKRYLLAQRV